MPQHHTTADQVNFVGEWFTSWSELQRTDFLPILVKELKQTDHVNGGLPEEFNALNLNSSNRPPSIFHCQVKLFHDWVASWSPEEKDKLLTLFKGTDAEFVEQYNKTLSDPKRVEQVEGEPLNAVGSGQRPAEEGQAGAAAVNAVPADAGGAAVANGASSDSDVDEALESSPSSPLSSPRPSDGHPDSGMDSPVEGVAEEDEGGHVVVMDEGREAVEQEGNEGE